MKLISFTAKPIHFGIDTSKPQGEHQILTALIVTSSFENFKDRLEKALQDPTFDKIDDLLNTALEHNKTQFVKHLLSKGANPNALSNNGQPVAEKYLIERIGIPNKQTPFGDTTEFRIIKLLIQAGLDVKKTEENLINRPKVPRIDENGNMVLLLNQAHFQLKRNNAPISPPPTTAAIVPTQSLITPNSPEWSTDYQQLIKDLKSQTGLDVKVFPAKGYMPPATTVKTPEKPEPKPNTSKNTPENNQDLKLIELLRSRDEVAARNHFNADVSKSLLVKTTEGRTVLHELCRINSMPFAQIILTRFNTQCKVTKNTEIGINDFDQYGNSALSQAVARNMVELVELLLKNGADPALKNHKGLSALDIATLNGYPSLAKILERHIKKHG